MDGNPTQETESLWGIESDSDDYLTEVSRDLADEIASRVKGQTFLKYTEVHIIRN